MKYQFKRMSLGNQLSVLIIPLVLVACSSTPTSETQQSSATTPATSSSTSKLIEKVFDPMSPASIRDPRSPLSKRSVYFDYDDFVVKSEYQTMLGWHAKFLMANPKMKMLIQGNADERGSKEYNLALGQKRSEAMKRFLKLSGVAESQLEAVSLGEERPVCTESDDSCWTRNRRGDVLYQGEF